MPTAVAGSCGHCPQAARDVVLTLLSSCLSLSSALASTSIGALKTVHASEGHSGELVSALTVTPHFWDFSALGSGDAAGPCWASIEVSSTVGSLVTWGRRCCTTQHV